MIYSKTIDFLIVGGGITGRLLQLDLRRRGASSMVWEEKDSNRSSIVAAGLANPLAGKFFTIGWRASEFFGNLSPFYQNLENVLETQFYKPCGMKRIISSAGEQNIWLSKAHQKKYVGFCSFSNENISGLHTPYGLLNVEQGGELDTTAFYNACSKHLPTKESNFDYRKLDPTRKIYDGIAYGKIIFCEGFRVENNPWFQEHMDIVPTKGEIIEIETELEPKGNIYLGGVFIQHITANKWRIGSTYEHGDTSINPTNKMKEEMISKLEKTLNLPFKITNHYCGTRPASADRKPILGRHPTINDMYVFNGLGSKAVSLTPLLAKEMCDYMINNAPLHEEIDIKRFC